MIQEERISKPTYQFLKTVSSRRLVSNVPKQAQVTYFSRAWHWRTCKQRSRNIYMESQNSQDGSSKNFNTFLVHNIDIPCVL